MKTWLKTGLKLLLAGGIRNLTTVSRFRAYKRLLGKKTQCALDKLARSVGKDVAFVRRDVQKMIGRGYFLEGHLDHEQKHLIISDDTYRQFEQARLQLEAAQRQREVAETTGISRSYVSRIEKRALEKLRKVLEE